MCESIQLDAHMPRRGTSLANSAFERETAHRPPTSHISRGASAIRMTLIRGNGLMMAAESRGPVMHARIA
jgi:hypothetical protein